MRDGFISTRAPTRGATPNLVTTEALAEISTRAPTRGATELFAAARWSIFYFYSRPYARGDLRCARPGTHAARFLLAPLREGRRFTFTAEFRRLTFLLAPLREGRQQLFTKPQVDLYDKLLKIHIFQINTFCILQHSFENFKDYFVGSARTSRKNVYGKGWR